MQSDGAAERACRSLSSEEPPNIAPPSITSQGLVLAGVVGVAHSPQTRHVRIMGPLSRRIRCLASVLCQPGVLIVSVLCHQVAVLGRAGVGKTCLIADLCGRGAPANMCARKYILPKSDQDVRFVASQRGPRETRRRLAQSRMRCNG